MPGDEHTLEDEISSVLQAILSDIDREADERFCGMMASPVVVEALGHVHRGDPESFRSAYSSPVEQAADALLRHALPHSPDARFLFANARFVSMQFRRLIEHYEGMSCCADKTRTVVRALARTLVHGGRIEFDRNQEYTFHLPKRVFATHDEIHGFFKAVQSLHYGYGQAYAGQLQILESTHAGVADIPGP
jgi:hypothetical protein